SCLHSRLHSCQACSDSVIPIHRKIARSHRDLQSFPTRRSSDLTVSSTFCWLTRGAWFSACCLSVTARCVLLSEQLLVVQGFPRFRRGIPASRRGCPSAAGP